MAKQTNILQNGKPLVRPDGIELFLISEDGWLKGQNWLPTPWANVQCQDKPRGPVWVTELLDIPKDYPKVTWVEDYPIVMRGSLPEGSRYAYSPYGVKHHQVSVQADDDTPVILWAWPDGSKPERPEAQELIVSKMEAAILFKERLGDLLMTDWYYGGNWRNALGYDGVSGTPSYVKVVITDDSSAFGPTMDDFVARITEEMSEFFTLQPAGSSTSPCYVCGGPGSWENDRGESFNCMPCNGTGRIER